MKSYILLNNVFSRVLFFGLILEKNYEHMHTKRSQFFGNDKNHFLFHKRHTSMCALIQISGIIPGNGFENVMNNKIVYKNEFTFVCHSLSNTHTHV